MTCQHPVAILAFNSSARALRCARSIIAGGLPDGAALQILDNGRDEKVNLSALPAEHVVRYRDIAGETRGGFTAALRWFLLEALREGATTATFLNDDIVLNQGCLAAMIDAAQEPGVGVACPMQTALHNDRVVICGGTGAAYPAGIHRTGPRGGGDIDQRRGVRWMPFAAVTINMDAVRDVGLPDRNMRTWFSDSDYCIRCRLAGWAVLYLGASAIIRHEQSAAIRATWPEGDKSAQERRRRAFVADMTAFARKWGGQILDEYSS